MHFGNAHRFAKPFAGDNHFDENFLLRVLKQRLEEWMQQKLDDDSFIEIIKAAHESNGSGPLPYGPILGPPQSFVRYFRLKGYEQETASEKGHRACAFFFNSTGIFRGAKEHVKVFDYIILHIPHSGRNFLKDHAVYQSQLERNAKDVIDYFTDELFTPTENSQKIIPVVFPYCRKECDVERMIDDPLESKNLGICYDSNILQPKHGYFNVKDVTFPFTEHEAYGLYLEHHHKVESLLVKHPYSLLVDCHSFSSYPTPLQPDYNVNHQYDICVGFNEDKTKPDSMIIGTIRDHFQSYGYRVGLNEPYSNSKTFNVPCSYKSIMIEVNKRCYMNEQSLTRNEQWDKLHECIERLYHKLLR